MATAPAPERKHRALAEQLYDESKKNDRATEYESVIHEVIEKAKGSSRRSVILDRAVGKDTIERLKKEGFDVSVANRPYVFNCPCSDGCLHCEAFDRTLVSWEKKIAA